MAQARDLSGTSDTFDARGALTALLWGAGRRVASVVTALQVSRMMHVLANFSDSELANLGLARSDIPQHARRLIMGDAPADRHGRGEG